MPNLNSHTITHSLFNFNEVHKCFVFAKPHQPTLKTKLGGGVCLSHSATKTSDKPANEKEARLPNSSFAKCMKQPFLFFTLLFALCTMAQTPHIMHLRMGGTEASFLTALQDPNAVIRLSNFGLPPTILVRKAVVDSVIAINDSTVVVVTSHQLKEEFQWRTTVYDSLSQDFVCTDTMIQRFLTYDSTGTWEPGRDTVVNHAVFNPQLSCREIHEKLARDFQIRQDFEQITFVGFDCSEQQQQSKRNAAPYFGWVSSQPPHFWSFLAVGLSLMYFLLLQIRPAKRYSNNKPLPS